MIAPVVLAELGDRSAFFAGDMGVVHAAVKVVGCARQYDRTRRALAVPRAAADDVMAALEMRFGVDIQLVQVIE